ncbi:MAG: AMP-binding protein [Gaiellaceae bacterium]
MNLACVLSDAASAHPERRALLFEGEQVSYGELDRRAAVAAAALEERGVRKDDRVALKLPNTPDYIAAYFGILRLGAVAVPLNVLLAQPEVDTRLEAAWPTAFVDSPLPAAGDRHQEIVDRDADDPAALLFTSGTTGGPKGAVLTHGGIGAATRFGADALSITDSDIVLGVAPFPHVLGQQVFFSSFAVGAAVCVMQRFEPEPALATMAASGTTVLMGVPTMCITLSQAAQTADSLPPLRIAHVGGAAVPIDIARRFEETFAADIHEGYGLTEMSGLATTFATGRLRKPGSVGQPSSSTDVRIANPDERGVGEVQFRGPSVIHGYWNDPAATAAAIDPEGWLSTGDLGRLDAGGDLFLVDRKKEMIIRGGYNIYPREVEEVLYEHPSVLEAAVVGLPHETLGEDVAAVVVARPATELDADELKAWAKERVAAYKYPRHVVVVDELPKSPTGKILKRGIDLASLFEEVERSS